MDGSRRVVLVGAGKAEIGENTITHELSDEAVVARDSPRAGVLVDPDHLPHVLGIEPLRKSGRADEIAKHHSQLPALGGVG